MKKKNGKIELLRFIFAAIIMVFHYPSSEIVTLRAQMGVEFFYIIMGVFMAQRISTEPQQDTARATVGYLSAKAKSFYKYFIPAFGIQTLLTVLSEELGFFSMLDRLVISIPQLLFLNSLGFHPDTYPGAIYVPASWFLSSALLGLFAVYPLAKRNWNVFVHILAPVMAAVSCAYLYLNFGTILVHYNFQNGINVALLRTIMDLAIGGMCWEASHRVKDKTSEKGWVPWVESILYAMIVWAMIKEMPGTVEIPILICMAAAVTLTISSTEKESFFDRKFFYCLGKISAPLYLLHCLVFQGMLLVIEDIQTVPWFVFYCGIAVGGAALWTYITEKMSGSKKKGNK